MSIELSIVIPAYNESARIGRTLASVRDHCNRAAISYEVIVVDDGSTDGTADVARAFSSEITDMIVLINKENRGKGSSVRRGMIAASGRYRLFMDADGSVDIAHIDRFMRAASDGADVVIGSIHAVASGTVREHNGPHRRILGKLANTLVQAIAVPGIRDTQRGFKLFSARAADFIFSRQTVERFGFDIELLLLARGSGFEIKELPVAWNNPAGSTVTLASYLHTLGELAYISINRMMGRYAPQEIVVGHAPLRGNIERVRASESPLFRSVVQK